VIDEIKGLETEVERLRKLLRSRPKAKDYAEIEDWYAAMGIWHDAIDTTEQKEGVTMRVDEIERILIRELGEDKEADNLLGTLQDIEMALRPQAKTHPLDCFCRVCWVWCKADRAIKAAKRREGNDG
jgi:predicted hydrolase (HD superfamily)